MRYHGRRVGSSRKQQSENHRTAARVATSPRFSTKRRCESSVDAPMADDRTVGICSRSMQAVYGTGSDARLLAGIMGHNLCLDIFGPPSDEEAQAGLDGARGGIHRAVRAELLPARPSWRVPGCRSRASSSPRRIILRETRSVIRETVDERVRPSIARSAGRSTSRWDRRFSNPERRSFVRRRRDRKCSKPPLAPTIIWSPQPSSTGRWRPRRDGASRRSSRVLSDTPRSSAYTAHLMDQNQSTAYLRRLHARPSSWPLDTSGSLRIFRGWEYGKRTTAD